MNVGQKLISGFLLAVLLVVIVGYFGIRTSNKAREGSILEAEMSNLALKVAEKGTVTFVATLTKDLDEFSRLEEKANQLRDEIDGISSALLKDSTIKNNVDFQSFLAVKNDHDKDQEQAFGIHRELLERQALFGDSPRVEEVVRQRLRAALVKTNNSELIKNFGSMEVLGKEAIFQYRDRKSVDAWIESIRKLRNNVGGENRVLRDHVTVYLQTAEIVGDIVVRESEINTDETNIVSAMRGREVELGILRKNIVDELSANVSRVYQNNRNILILIIAGMLTVMGSTSFFLSQRIIKPIEALTAVVMKIAGGDLRARAQVFSTDEIGILARSFNQTADRLAEYPLQLQQEVKKKTRELTDINTRLQELLHENYVSAKMLVRRDIELTEANARLQGLDTAKSEFISVAAHQLRTPLTGIRWSYHTLLEKETGPLNEEQRKLLEEGLRTTLRMVDLTNDLLNVARIEEGGYEFVFKRQQIAPIIQQSALRFQEAAAEKGITINVNIPTTPLPALDIDAERFIITLDNLLDNGIKYTAPGGIVSVDVSVQEDAVRITVRDTGIGIPREQLPQVFSKFFRADNALLFQTAGTGLGLYVVKNIVERHNGTVTVESKEGKGTSIIVSLPIPKEQPAN